MSTAPQEGSVYIVQAPTAYRDLSSAQRYGKLVPVLDAGEQPSAAPRASLHKLNKAFRNFLPDRDFVCYVGGDPMSLALALIALREQGFKEVQTLRWDRERDTEGNRTRGGYYVPVTTPLFI